MKRKKEEGSATIEATVCLSVFMFCMLFFIMIVQLTVTQTIMQNALNQTAKELSQDLYLYDALGLINFRQDLSELNDKTNKEIEKVESAVSDAKNELSSDGDMVTNVQNAFKAITSIFSDKNDPEGIKDDFIEKFSPANLKTGGKTVINAALDSLVSAGENAMIPVLFKKYVSSDGKSGTADAYLKKLHVVNGVKGLDFGKSSMFGTWSFKEENGEGTLEAGPGTEKDMDKEASGESGKKQGDKNTINLILEYKVEILHPIEGWKEVKCIQSSATRVWTGDGTIVKLDTDKDKTDKKDNKEEIYVYYATKYGERYHPDRNCMTLARSTNVIKITVKEAESLGLTLCAVCGK